ncbi:hypothetical protein KP509_16G029700 [Ceratopteris richardii]|uniref:Uncharacterized protein n=1 Tax=Ceratopteris richardii TaxID=49495 RepID=A0A8T2T1Y5_CERRI|nr:hypothetical protein KP509_16G029700 [Ceratopteris richardii]
MECPAKASANSSTMGHVPTFFIATLLIGCRSCMKCSFPFALGTMNHQLEYGTDDGSRILIAIFSFNNIVNSHKCAFGSGVGRRFHGICGTMNMIIGATSFKSVHPIACGNMENAFSCPIIISLNRSFSISERNSSPKFIHFLDSSVNICPILDRSLRIRSLETLLIIS